MSRHVVAKKSSSFDLQCHFRRLIIWILFSSILFSLSEHNCIGCLSNALIRIRRDKKLAWTEQPKRFDLFFFYFKSIDLYFLLLFGYNQNISKGTTHTQILHMDSDISQIWKSKEEKGQKYLLSHLRVGGGKVIFGRFYYANVLVQMRKGNSQNGKGSIRLFIFRHVQNIKRY